MIRCGKRFHIVQKTELDNLALTVFPHRCKSWDCDTCRRGKSKKVTAAINSRFGNGPCYFLTLTYDRSRGIQETWKNLGASWNALITHARKNNPAFSYIRIVEPHKNQPFPHLHILTSINIFTKSFFLLSKTLGFGQQQQQTTVTSDRARQYVTKYLGKAWPNNGAEALRKSTKTRILSTSRDFGALFMTHSTGKMIGLFLTPQEAVSQVQGAAIQEAYSGNTLTSWEITEYNIRLNYNIKEVPDKNKHVISRIIDAPEPWISVTIYSADGTYQTETNL